MELQDQGICIYLVSWYITSDCLETFTSIWKARLCFDREKVISNCCFDWMINETKHFLKWLLAAGTYYSRTVCSGPPPHFLQEHQGLLEERLTGCSQLVCSLIHSFKPAMRSALPLCQEPHWALRGDQTDKNSSPGSWNVVDRQKTNKSTDRENNSTQRARVEAQLTECLPSVHEWVRIPAQHKTSCGNGTQLLP